ncbi:PREDICTED: uncharacterized protein LOC105366330 [Ceratosolen solmsi marchali]|uniref:Uncharacterized protein LOC105366330 n=1 Tax=Ceratosolen solmsi marchali TaxID=326594 RepID=A0AAJ7E0C9_9HYME|nr:PREDICTED: uncharacterized protein LOC105366330 [Ceratosolen solmsi marchali]
MIPEPMDIPAFPAPPSFLSVSVSRSLPPDGQAMRRRSFEFPRRRPRSASWLPTRRHTRRCRERTNHVQPLGARIAPRLHRSPRSQKPGPGFRMAAEDEGHRDGEPTGGHADMPNRTTRDNRCSRIIKENQVDESDIICCETTEVNNGYSQKRKPVMISIVCDRMRPIELEEAQNSGLAVKMQKIFKSAESQTSDRILYRLRVFPTLKDIVDENKILDPKKSSRIFRYFRFLGRIALCQFGLAWLLTLWTILGAGAFYITESPRELHQVIELKDMQRDLAVGLATELRQLRANDEETEPLWSAKVRQYVARHEKLLLVAVSSGYGEGGDNGQLWTFPGCVLFAVSVITTLGFGAPVPRTNAGRTVAVIFAAIGIPAHFLLMLNIGLLLAVALRRYSIAKKYPSECRDSTTMDSIPMPTWVKVLPYIAMGAYYILGILCFGAARLKPFSESLLFPLEFTAAGGLSTIVGYVRILYSIYLEGAVTLAAIAVAVLKVSATQSLTNIGLKYGLLVPA